MGKRASIDKGAAPPVKQVRVRAPATSANLGAGFDCLGLALELYMDLTVEESAGEGLEIAATGEGSASVPLDERNAVYQGVMRAYMRAGKTPGRLRLTIDSQIPLASGLGSSSAALVAGLTAGSRTVRDEAGSGGDRAAGCGGGGAPGQCRALRVGRDRHRGFGRRGGCVGAD